jgi:hypothetical protein
MDMPFHGFFKMNLRIIFSVTCHLTTKLKGLIGTSSTQNEHERIYGKLHHYLGLPLLGLFVVRCVLVSC